MIELLTWIPTLVLMLVGVAYIHLAWLWLVSNWQGATKTLQFLRDSAFGFLVLAGVSYASALAGF